MFPLEIHIFWSGTLSIYVCFLVISMKIISFSRQESKAICILSGSGAMSNVTVRAIYILSANGLQLVNIDERIHIVVKVTFGMTPFPESTYSSKLLLRNDTIFIKTSCNQTKIENVRL